MAITNSTLLSERMAVERLRNWVRMEIHMVPNDTTIDGRQELYFAASNDFGIIRVVGFGNKNSYSQAAAYHQRMPLFVSYF